jgi:Flp pilus assembly protein TadG
MREEEGAITIWVVFISVAMLALAGLVIDGGYAMSAKREAARAAEQAARTAADQLDTDSLRTGGNNLSATDAVAAGRAYLAGTGESGTVAVNGNAVTVTVTKTQRSVILSAFAKDSFTVSSTATARSIERQQGAP